MLRMTRAAAAAADVATDDVDDDGFTMSLGHSDLSAYFNVTITVYAISDHFVA